MSGRGLCNRTIVKDQLIAKMTCGRQKTMVVQDEQNALIVLVNSYYYLLTLSDSLAGNRWRIRVE